MASLLSVGEFALAAGAGLNPLGPVQGADVRLASVLLDPPRRTVVRWAGPSAASRAEIVQAVPALDAEVRAARERVLAQLRQQAVKLSADIVIGVHRLQDSVASERVQATVGHAAGFAEKRNGNGLLDVRGLVTQYAGSAARRARSAGSATAPAADTELCTVSAEDHWKLDRGGWRTVGLVGGCSHWLGVNVSVGWGVHELAGTSKAWASARREAFAEMNAQAVPLGADGVISIDLRTVEHRHVWYPGSSTESHGIVVGVDLIGTAIQRTESESPPLSPLPIVSLR